MEVKSYLNTDNTQDVHKIRELLDAKGEYHFSFVVSLIIKKHRKDVQVDLISSND